jgi:acyl-coenzyme A thioesterase PaaI-like protein
MNSTLLRHLINCWPPYLFAGIRATHLSADYRSADVELREHWYNRNYVGTHFGGSLFAMTDAWYMIMLIQCLGRDYYVWDQRATIEYVSPGKGTVRAQFRLNDEILRDIRDKTASGDKYLPEFSVEIVNADGQVVARVNRIMYVRKKKTALDKP